MGVERALAFEVDEFRARVASVREAMAQRNLRGLILFSPQNIYYLSGMDTETMYGTQALVLGLTEDPTLVLHSFERGRAENSCWLEGIAEFPSTDGFVPAVIAAARTNGVDTGQVGVEQRSWAPLAAPVSPAAFGQLRESLTRAELVDPWGIVEDLRLCKSPAEVTYMRAAGHLTEIGMAAGMAAVGDGVLDTEVAAEICHAIYGAGSELMCWGPIVAAGFRSGAPHSTFARQTIRRGETVLLELTGEVRRYVAPALRTAFVGDPPPEINLVSERALKAVAAVLETAGPGVLGSEVARAGQAALSGLPKGLVFHGTFGYPVGLGFPPSWGEYRGYLIRSDNTQPLREGMTFHLAVSFRRYGQYGVCHSQTMVVTSTGAEALTDFPASLTIA